MLLGFRNISALNSAVSLGFTGTANAYDNAHSYSAGDMSTYAGGTYVAIQATTGHFPTDTTYWIPIDSATNGFPVGTKAIVVESHTKSIRWRADGIAPTASVGMMIPDSLVAYSPKEFTNFGGRFSVDMKSIKIIEIASSASADVTFWGETS